LERAAGLNVTSLLAAGGGENATQVLLALLIVFVAGLVGSEISQRLQMPSVVGQIAAGILIGPSVWNWAAPNEPMEVLSELGAIILLFSVGLETRLADIRKVGRIAMVVGMLGVIVPFIAGGAWALASGFSVPKAAFVAAAFVATSAGITARVLQELKVMSSEEAKIILGAAVIDDVLAMLILGVVTALQTEAGVDFVNLLIVLVQAVGFVGLVAILGTKIMRRSNELLDGPMDAESPLSLSLAICLGLAVAAAFIGLAAIIGAFLAGMILAETRHRHEIERQTKAILTFFLPFFFVVTGMMVQVSALASWPAIGTVLLVTVLALLSKLIGCGLAARSRGRTSAAIIGIGMVPRGEVGIIIASLGKQAGVFPAPVHATIIAMSLLTAVVAPPVLKKLFAKKKDEPPVEPPQPAVAPA
jgi:Kef-type K+ transport system membrane component KefB